MDLFFIVERLLNIFLLPVNKMIKPISFSAKYKRLTQKGFCWITKARKPQDYEYETVSHLPYVDPATDEKEFHSLALKVK